MGAPHNKDRYGETWPDMSIFILKQELEKVKDFVVVSGGWVWHLITPVHSDYKHAHDLKDIDVYVKGDVVWEFVALLKEIGYEREHTKYDNLSPFYRYVRFVNNKKVIFDVFVGDVPFVEVGGFKVVDPAHLVTLYHSIHGSGQCFSVALAREILAAGENPVNHPKMADYSRFLKS